MLFVSEKAAALNVVHERLKKCGLGPFCLALHSNKSHKVQVIRQLYETMECFAARTEDEWRREGTPESGGVRRRAWRSCAAS